MEMVIIYTLSDNKGDIRYVGKTKNETKKRLYAHINECNTDRKSHKINWIKSILNKGERPIINIVDEVPVNEWQFWEIYWIEQFRQWGFNLTNQTIGGDGGNGYKHSSENKLRMRKSKLGTTLSNEQKKKISDSVKERYKENPSYNRNKGNLKVPLDRDLLYQKYIVENLSMPKCAEYFNVTETRIFRNLKDYSIIKDKALWTKQCSNNKVAEDRIVFQYGLDGKLIKKWNSHLEAANELNIDYKSIMSVCSKREGFKSYKRFIWRYNLEEINILELYKRRV